jgi:hypothetical protein
MPGRPSCPLTGNDVDEYFSWVNLIYHNSRREQGSL